VVKVPNTKGKSTENRVEQCREGHDIAFFVIDLRLHVHGIRQSLVDCEVSSTGTLSAAERIISHDPVGLKPSANESNMRSYAPYGNTGSIHTREQIRRIYAPPCFPSQHRSLAPSAQYKELASEVATEVKGGTREGPVSMGSCTQGLVCGGLPAGDLQRRVQCGARAHGTEMDFQLAGTGGGM